MSVSIEKTNEALFFPQNEKTCFLKSYLRKVALYNSSKIKVASMLKELQSTTS